MSADQRPSSAKRTSSASGAAKKSPTPAAQQQQQQQAHTSTSPTPLHLKAAQMPSDRLTAPLPSASLPSPPRTESWDDPRQMASSSSSSSSSRRSTLGGAAASSSSAIHAARPMQEHATYDSTSSSIYAYQPHHHQHTAAAAAAAAAAQLQAAATLGVASSSSATSPTHTFVPSPNAVPYSPAAINGTAVSSPLTAEWPPGSIADDNILVGGGSEGGPTNGTLADSGSGTGAGGSSNGGGAPALTAPYPGRAASLPGSIHYPQSARSRSAMPSSSSREGTAGQGYGANASSSGTTSSTKFRDNPQLRAQIAQQVANGTLPPAVLSHHQQPHQSQQQHHHQQSQQPAIPYERYTAELTNCIIAFLSPMLPTEEEYRMKEATRRQLERLTGKVSPGAKLLAFGSMANGFALRNSDMDLCCLIANKSSSDDSDSKEAQPPPPQLSASELVERLAEVIRAETDYKVLPLPKARIPIIKLSRASSSEFPYEISCDIGFENRLALENTRLLLSYAMVDPPRLRTLVLFLKVWTKRRKLNTPFMGTLSSYGYTLLVLFFLCHVKRPAVLPNLQRIPPTRPLTPEEVQLNGHNIYFYDDMATLRNEWQSQNQENVAELLIDFFRYFAKEFVYSRDVVSLRTEGGLIPKDGGVWSAELCIEDPFQLGYNVSRTVTKDGLYTIRGEFMRAMRILQNRGQRVSAQLAELCEEREDIVARAPDTPPPRHRYMPASHHAPYYVDARTMRELYYDAMPPRRTSHHVQPSGHGGSFAFEEMARGLGRQRSQMAYPSQAMLAPLSQQGGLSPKPVHRAPPSADESPTKSASSSNGSTKGSSGGTGRSTTKAASSLRHQQSAHDSEGEKEADAEPSQEDGSPGGASSSRQSSTLHSAGSDDGEDDGASSVSTATTATGAGLEAHQQQQQRAEQGSAVGQVAGEEKESRRSTGPKQQQPSTSTLGARPPTTAHQRRSSSPSSSKRRPTTLPGPDDLPHHHNSASLPQHASARTSPNLNPTVPPQSVVDAADGQGGPANDDVGEAWAFGSEIVFGSERFRLHPHPHHHHHYHQHQFQHQQHQQQQQQHRRQTSAGQQTMPGVAATDSSGSDKQGSTTTTKAAAHNDAASTPSPETAHRTSRALSDGGGINRSMSLPPRRHYNSVAPKSTLPPSEAGGSDDEGDVVAAAPAADDSLDDFRSVSGASASASVLSLAESSSRAGSAAPKEEPRSPQPRTQQQQPATPQQQEGESDANVQPPMAEYTAEWAQKQFAQQQQERAGKDKEGKADEGDEGDETIVLPPMPAPQSPPRSQQPSSKQQQQQQPGKQRKKQRKASTSSSVASSSASRPQANGKASQA